MHNKFKQTSLAAALALGLLAAHSSHAQDPIVTEQRQIGAFQSIELAVRMMPSSRCRAHPR